MIPASRRATLLLALAPLAATAAPVPWLDEPDGTPRNLAVNALPSMPCRDADLQLTLGGAGAYRGQATQELLLRNRSPRACLLNATPAIELASPSGWKAAISATDEAMFSIDLQADATLTILLGTPGACEATLGPERHVVRRLRVLAPGGGSLQADGAHVDTTCGPPKVVHTQQHVPVPEPAPGTPQVLSAELVVPSSATVGDALDYVVTLKNPTGQAVSLAPCPSYRQVLNAATASTKGNWRLNCAGAGGVVPAHGAIQFEMRAIVPLTASHEGGVKLSWNLFDGPAVGTVIPLR